MPTLAVASAAQNAEAQESRGGTVRTNPPVAAADDAAHGPEDFDDQHPRVQSPSRGRDGAATVHRKCLGLDHRVPPGES
jgi:hypothetical protein